jgi:hypothetical protein
MILNLMEDLLLSVLMVSELHEPATIVVEDEEEEAVDEEAAEAEEEIVTRMIADPLDLDLPLLIALDSRYM